MFSCTFHYIYALLRVKYSIRVLQRIIVVLNKLDTKGHVYYHSRNLSTEQTKAKSFVGFVPLRSD